MKEDMLKAEIDFLKCKVAMLEMRINQLENARLMTGPWQPYNPSWPNPTYHPNHNPGPYCQPPKWSLTTSDNSSSIRVTYTGMELQNDNQGF